MKLSYFEVREPVVLSNNYYVNKQSYTTKFALFTVYPYSKK